MMMIRNVLVSFFFLLFSLPALAEGVQIATIIEVEGEVNLIRSENGDVVKLTPVSEEAVFLDDVIETGANSKTHILFIDDTELTLGEEASLRVDEYIFDPDSMNGNKGRFSLTRGVFLFVSGLLSKGDYADVEIETVYGSIGIRGTRLWSGVLEGEEGYGVLVEDGEVVVRTDRGRVRVGTGQAVSVKNRYAVPSKAKEWSQEKINRMLGTVKLKRQDIVRARVGNHKERHVLLRAQYKKNLQEYKSRQSKEIKNNRYQKRKNFEQRIKKRNTDERVVPEDSKVDGLRMDNVEKPKSIKEKKEGHKYNPL